MYLGTLGLPNEGPDTRAAQKGNHKLIDVLGRLLFCLFMRARMPCIIGYPRMALWENVVIRSALVHVYPSNLYKDMRLQHTQQISCQAAKA